MVMAMVIIATTLFIIMLEEALEEERVLPWARFNLAAKSLVPLHIHPHTQYFHHIVITISWRIIIKSSFTIFASLSFLAQLINALWYRSAFACDVSWVAFYAQRASPNSFNEYDVLKETIMICWPNIKLQNGVCSTVTELFHCLCNSRLPVYKLLVT